MQTDRHFVYLVAPSAFPDAQSLSGLFATLYQSYVELSRGLTCRYSNIYWALEHVCGMPSGTQMS